MPRKSKQKKNNAAAAAAATEDASPPPAEDKAAGSDKTDKIGCLFDSYANKSLGMIDPEGIEALCSDVGMDYTDVRLLVLAWKMKAEKQGYFTKEEWRRGLKALKVDSLAKLKKALPELDKEVKASPNFADFYSYAFQYCLTEERQKNVDMESTCQLLGLVLGPQFPAQTKLFTEYLKDQNDYRVINMDQWTSFLRFFNDISFPDLGNYDPTEAWPLILDNFVDWMKERES